MVGGTRTFKIGYALKWMRQMNKRHQLKTYDCENSMPIANLWPREIPYSHKQQGIFQLNTFVDWKKELWVRLNVHAYSESLIIRNLAKSLSSVAISNLPRFAEAIDHNE